MAGNACVTCKICVDWAQCRVCCLSSQNKDRTMYSMKPKTCADNLHALDSYELHNRIVALRPMTWCSSVLAIHYDMRPSANKCLSSRKHFLQIVRSNWLGRSLDTRSKRVANLDSTCVQARKIPRNKLHNTHACVLSPQFHSYKRQHCMVDFAQA